MPNVRFYSALLWEKPADQLVCCFARVHFCTLLPEHCGICGAPPCLTSLQSLTTLIAEAAKNKASLYSE